MSDVSPKLTPHFTLAELNKRGEQLTPELIGNLKRLAIKLEEVREKLGNRPITVTSGYRSPAWNRRVGGVSNSWHIKGLAADIKVAGISPQRVQRMLEDWWPGGLGKASTFTHLDLGPRRIFYYSRTQSH